MKNVVGAFLTDQAGQPTAVAYAGIKLENPCASTIVSSRHLSTARERGSRMQL